MKEEFIQVKNYTWIKAIPRIGPSGHGDEAEEGQSQPERGRGSGMREKKTGKAMVSSYITTAPEMSMVTFQTVNINRCW